MARLFLTVPVSAWFKRKPTGHSPFVLCCCFWWGVLLKRHPLFNAAKIYLNSLFPRMFIHVAIKPTSVPSLCALLCSLRTTQQAELHALGPHSLARVRTWRDAERNLGNEPFKPSNWWLPLGKSPLNHPTGGFLGSFNHTPYRWQVLRASPPKAPKG